MQGSRRRVGTGNNGGVIAGSVWESRMKVDEVKGGVKVFNGESGGGEKVCSRKLKRNQSGGVSDERRKDSKAETNVVVGVIEKNPIQIKKTKSESHRQTSDAIEKNPIKLRKSRSDNCREVVVCKEKVKSLSELNNVGEIKSERVVELVVEDDDGVDGDKEDDEEEEEEMDEEEEDIVMDVEKVEEEEMSFDDKEINILPPPPPPPSLEQPKKVIDEEKMVDQIHQTPPTPPPPPIHKKPTLMASNVNKQPPPPPLEQPKKVIDEEKMVDQIHQTPPTPPPLEQPKKVIDEEKMVDQIHQTPPTPPPPPPIHKKPTLMASNVNKQPPIYKRRIPISSNAIKEAPSPKKSTPKSSIVNKEPPQVTHHPVIEPEYIRVPPNQEEFHGYPQPQSKLQNIVDLVMWRDVSKSAFVFGLGTFVLLSSSFTKDINFSVISAISYMGLVYLAAIFVYRTIVCRGAIDVEELNDQTCLVGEEEAIWFIEVILPYLNEFLLKIRSLFSGDPATTMKVAALLFVLARCGSSITIWKLFKLGFFGVFTVPKVCSSYSSQLNGFGKFWIRRFRDAWDSCSHKKAVGAAIFTLVWNLSSITARIWAAFMLVVAFKYYQQRMLREQWEEEEAMAKEKKG